MLKDTGRIIGREGMGCLTERLQGGGRTKERCLRKMGVMYIQGGCYTYRMEGCEEGKYEDKQVINCKIEIILCI